MVLKAVYRIVIAIDFGTSRSGYAYAFLEDRTIYGRTEWPGQQVPYCKTLTDLLYTPGGEAIAWGYEARRKLAELRKNHAARDYYFFSRFKMKLREGNKTADGPVENQNGRQFLVVNLISDYLRFIKDLALEEIRERTAGHLLNEEILWCLTVPAIWTDAEKYLMRQAARKAGLIGTSDLESERLWLILEPEAAAIYCQERDKLHLSAGTRFIVVDCGGGTADIIAYETVMGEGLKEIAPGTGGAYGSTYVDESFIKKILQPRLTAEAISKLHDEEPVEYLEMIATWERIKCAFDPHKSTSIYFPIQPRLLLILTKHYPDVLKRLAKEQDGEDANVILSSKDMSSIFNPSIDGIVQSTQEQFNRLGSQRCDYIFLVGGFSTSPVLQQRIKDEFGTRVKKIVILPEPGAAIVQGAASFGLKPSIIRARRSRLTYGCDISAPFDQGIDPESKKFWSEAHKSWYCKDRFHTFVNIGQTIEVNEKVTHNFYPMDPSQTSVTFKFYGTKEKRVRYSDENSLEKIGQLTVEMPDTTGGINRCVEVMMYFGKTEIQVEARDITSGKKCETTLLFHYTYSSDIVG
jgi:molecular chaperone DnaK (HSP70)